MNHVATTRTLNETRRFMGCYGTREEDRPACAHTRRTGEVGGWLCVKRQHRAGALRARLSATVQLPCGNSWTLQFQKSRTCEDANSTRHTLVLERIPATSAPTVQTAKRCHVRLFGRLEPLVEMLSTTDRAISPHSSPGMVKVLHLMWYRLLPYIWGVTLSPCWRSSVLAVFQRVLSCPVDELDFFGRVAQL